jgi:hypothetical protein
MKLFIIIIVLICIHAIVPGACIGADRNPAADIASNLKPDAALQARIRSSMSKIDVKSEKSAAQVKGLLSALQRETSEPHLLQQLVGRIKGDED